MSLIQAKNQTEFNLDSLSDGLFFVITTTPDSELFQSQQEKILPESNLLFVTDQEVENENFIIDADRELVNKSEKVSEQNNLGENFLVFEKKGSEIKFIDIKESPESEYNWAEVCTTVLQNYAEPKPDDDGYYKWGQVVPETGEYLCKDCGYVEEFEEGSIFPICVVCIAGEPSGPSGPSEGYWERV